MRELEKEFIGKGEVKGCLFRQVSFENNWYIYSVQFPEQNNVSHYEVFRRKEVKALPPFAPEDYVQYPKANFFGVVAWTAKTLERAKEIVKERSSSNNNEDINVISD